MSAHAARLARIFTPTYACRINAQLLHPVNSRLVNPNALSAALLKPLQVAMAEPQRPATYLAATLSHGIMTG